MNRSTMARTPLALSCLIALATASGCISTRSAVASVVPDDASGARPTRSVPPAVPRIPDHPMTTAACVAYAWAHNRTVARARWRSVAARAAVDEADAELMPSLRADGAASARSRDAGVTFNGGSFVTGDRAVATGDVLASVPLFGTPALGARSAATHGLAGARAEVDRARDDLALDVTEAVMTLREARARLSLIASSVEDLTEQVRIADDRQHAGLALPTDALADRVRLAEREQDRLHGVNDIALAEGRLDRLLGLPIDTAIALADDPEPTMPPVGEDELVTRALAARRDLAAMRERLLQAEDEVRATRSAYLPQARLVGGWYVTSDSLVLNHEWFGGGVDVSVPLLDSGVVAARVDAARARASEVGLAEQELMDGIRQEVHEAVLAMREASARLPVASLEEDLAKQRLDQVRDQYQQGVADMTSVLTAENDAVMARLQTIRVRMDSQRAAARIAHATSTSMDQDR